jgi:hypothetical protein
MAEAGASYPSTTFPGGPPPRASSGRIRGTVRLALFEPDQAGNVVAILRTAACFGVAVDIIEPCGFGFAGRAPGSGDCEARDRAACVDLHEEAVLRGEARLGGFQQGLEQRSKLPFREGRDQQDAGMGAPCGDVDEVRAVDGDEDCPALASEGENLLIRGASAEGCGVHRSLCGVTQGFGDPDEGLSATFIEQQILGLSGSGGRAAFPALGVYGRRPAPLRSAHWRGRNLPESPRTSHPASRGLPRVVRRSSFP